MPEIKDRFKFEPNHDARATWLGTRKRPIDCGRQTLPGFYQTAGYGTDVGWVMLALCVEVAAVALTLYGGFSKGDVFLVGAVIVVVLFLVFDYVGTVFTHRPIAERCRIKNMIHFTNDIGAKQGLRNELKKGIFIQTIGVVLIFLSAVLKIVAILLLGSFNLMFYVIMALLYLIVIYIHIFHTGYFFAELRTEKMFKKQHAKWANSKMLEASGQIEAVNIPLKARELNSPFNSDIELNIKEGVPISIGDHSIELRSTKEENGKTIYSYSLKTTGILLDDDIQLLINGQNAEQAGIIALECRKHQVNRIH